MGKGNERFGAWSFSAVWRFPEDAAGQQSQNFSLMDSALGCFVLELESCPQYLSYFEFKYSLSDWEVARNRKAHPSACLWILADGSKPCNRQ